MKITKSEQHLPACGNVSKLDAAFIVTACNSHASLVAALEKIVELGKTGDVHRSAQVAFKALALTKP